MLFGDEAAAPSLATFLWGGGAAAAVTALIAVLIRAWEKKRDADRKDAAELRQMQAEGREADEKRRFRYAEEENARLDRMLQIQKDASDTVKDERRELSKEMTRRIGQLERQIAEMMEDIQCKQHIIDHYRRGGRVADEPE